MPVYNAERYLRETMESVLAQSFENFTFIIVNDGSLDGSADIVRHFMQRDKRILFLEQKENRGISAALNLGLTKAKSKWVARIDADDIMLPNRLERQLSFLQDNPDVGVTASLVALIGETGKGIGTSNNVMPDRAAYERYVQHRSIPGLYHSSVMMQREGVQEAGGYRRAFDGSEDYDLRGRLMERGVVFLVQDEVLLKYRILSSSICGSANMNSHIKDHWVVASYHARLDGKEEPDWEQFLKSWRGKPVLERFQIYRKMYANQFYRQGGSDLISGRPFRGGVRLAAAALTSPAYTFSRLYKQQIKPRLKLS